MGHYLQIREGFPVKSALGCVIFCLLLTGLLAGCCGQPAQEIDAAKTAVDAAVSEGAEKFSPGEARKVDAELTAAMDEVNTQENKVFRDYAKAKRMLLQVKSDADAMNAGLVAKKAAARKDAEGAFVAAKFAVERAGAALGKAPERIPVERESLAAEVKILDDSLFEVRKLIDTEDCLTAFDNARALKAKASAVAKEIGLVIRKAALKKAKRKSPGSSRVS
jgi:hypothetical protein